MPEEAHDEGRASQEPLWPKQVLLTLTAVSVLALTVVAFIVGRSTAPPGGLGGPVSSGPPHVAGASRTENGVPVGYQQTDAGAAAAATNYVQIVGGPLLLHPDRYQAALETLAAPEASLTLLADAPATVSTLPYATIAADAARGVHVSVAAYPLAYHVDSFESYVAEVSVWYVSVIGDDAESAPTQTWATMRVGLEWTDGDWKVNADRTDPGPVPVFTQASLQTRVLPPPLRDFRTYEYSPVR